MPNEYEPDRCRLCAKIIGPEDTICGDCIETHCSICHKPRGSGGFCDPPHIVRGICHQWSERTANEEPPRDNGYGRCVNCLAPVHYGQCVATTEQPSCEFCTAITHGEPGNSSRYLHTCGTKQPSPTPSKSMTVEVIASRELFYPQEILKELVFQGYNQFHRLPEVRPRMTKATLVIEYE